MATQTRGEAAEKRSGGGRASKRASRTTPALFFRQIVGELRKVIWPTRKELITYTSAGSAAWTRRSGPHSQGRRDSNPQPPVLETGTLAN